MTRHTCTCTACNGNTILAPQGLIHGSPKQQANLTHSYVAYAHGTSPMAKMLTARAGVVRA